MRFSMSCRVLIFQPQKVNSSKNTRKIDGPYVLALERTVCMCINPLNGCSHLIQIFLHQYVH